MARTRSLIEMRGDVRRRADVESADERHPDADITRYINQGMTELRDLLIEARGLTYFRKDPPQTITTTDNTTRYPLSADFNRLIAIRLAGSFGYCLTPFTTQDEPALRAPGVTAGPYPTHYQLQPGYVAILPVHSAGAALVVDYIPTQTDLVADGDLFDGFNGWEEYVVDFAAHCIAVKDARWELARSLEADIKKLSSRVLKLAPKRDAFRAERVKDVRGFFGGRRFR